MISRKTEKCREDSQYPEMSIDDETWNIIDVVHSLEGFVWEYDTLHILMFII